VRLLLTPPQWYSPVLIRAPRSLLSLICLDQGFDISLYSAYRHFSPHSSPIMSAPQSPPQPRLGASQFVSRLLTSLSIWRCSPGMGCSEASALLNPCRRSLACICAPPFHSALLHHHKHSPRLPHQALLLCWWLISFSPEFIKLPFNLHFDSPQANLNSKPFRYHKLSQTTLEFNCTYLPGHNDSEIPGAPAASFRC
jgi:hypothetical protein